MDKMYGILELGWNSGDSRPNCVQADNLWQWAHHQEGFVCQSQPLDRLL